MSAYASLISRLLNDHGLTLHGFCAFEAIRPYLLPCRAASRLPEAAKSVCVALFPYRFPGDPPRNLARYACVPDYHETAGALLKEASAALAAALPSFRFEAFIDNSPLPEIRAAVLSGLGLQGDNGLFFHSVYGSFVLIGTIVTDAPLPCPPPAENPGCLHCGACAAACPTGCLSRSSGTTTCLSAITQKKGDLTAEERALVQKGGLVFGCDRCQEVCPLNRAAAVAPHPCFSSFVPMMTAADLDNLRHKAYGWRGRAVLERNLALLSDEPPFSKENPAKGDPL